MKKLLGQIIALTKNIHLKNPAGNDYGLEQFGAGKKDPFNFGGGIVISWWYTEKSFRLLEEISFIISGELEEFSGCDHDTIQETVRTTLHEVCVDEKVFKDVFFSRKSTLFDCRRDGDVTSYAQYILERCLSNLRASIADWCVVYTVPKLQGGSFSIGVEGIEIVSKSDVAAWEDIEKSGFPLSELDQERGSFRDGSATAFTHQNYEYYLIVKAHGTQQGCKFLASLKFRKLLSVIYAVSSTGYRSKAEAKPHSIALQIPSKSSGIGAITQSDLGELLPYYLNDTVLGDTEVNAVIDWYDLECGLPFEQRSRISKCAHFVNKGMNTNDIDSYIHYFVALDALFGRRGSVEDSIKNGVSLLPHGAIWCEKVSWLFDLRNELVHGGSRFIREWPKYMKYYRHFSTEPSVDMEELAFLALRSAPRVFKREASCQSLPDAIT